jgi:hypothetical protein
MNTNVAIAGIQKLCRDSIEGYEVLADLAVSKAWRMHIPVEYADSSLADEIIDRIDEWCTDNDCESLAADITVDDIIFS